MSSANYTAKNIKVLKGLEAVRKRPGMYIGNTEDGSGLHHLFHEALDNAIDEHMVGFCSEIKVFLDKKGEFIEVSDNGRGIPIEMHSDTNVPTAELIFTTLHAGGKFDHDSYKVFGGLHGVGVSVVNALSEKLELEINRDGKKYFIEFKNGESIKPLKEIGKSKESGTQITFLPSKEIFSSIKVILIPLFRNASSRILFINIFPLNFIDEKISFDGRNVICVPDSLDLPISLSGFIDSPFLNSIKYFLPSLFISNSNFSDKAFTTETPTPCNPPNTL
jgi:DNA gyrase/topoisomerase IV subunit B